MKSNAASKQRAYNQTARAAAAEETGRRILDAFIERLEQGWLEDITLDMVAADAGVTVQTVIRRFGGKQGLLEAAGQRISEGVDQRRATTPGDIDQAIDQVLHDYEHSGDLMMRILTQEDRDPAIRAVTDLGRAFHREWVTSAFGPYLEDLSAGERTARIDALVIATDLYVWKLVRRDMKRSRAKLRAIVLDLVHAALTVERAQS